MYLFNKAVAEVSNHCGTGLEGDEETEFYSQQVPATNKMMAINTLSRCFNRDKIVL